MTSTGIPFPLRASACGAVTAVGAASVPTFAALRAGITAFRETCYRTSYGEPIVGAPIVDLDARTLGHEYLAAMARPALEECLAAVPWKGRTGRIGFLLGVSDALPPVDAQRLLKDLATHQAFGGTSHLLLVATGEHSIIYALAKAAEWIGAARVDVCVVGGVDSLLSKAAVDDLERRARLKTSRNSDGTIPGEAACFVAVTRADDDRVETSRAALVVRSVALREPHGGLPRRGDGLAFAVTRALAEAGIAAGEVDFRPSSQSGESVPALESGIAGMRIFRELGPYPPAWLPAESIGSIGSAVGALLLGWAAAGFEKEYAPGRVGLVEVVSSDGRQGAAVITAD